MRDGIGLARRHTPAAALVVTHFLPQGDFVANAVGMPGVPRVEIPAVAGSSDGSMIEVAESLAPQLLAAFAGVDRQATG